MRRQRLSDDSGFTLLEVIVTTLLLGIMAGLMVGPWKNFGQSQAHRGAERELVAALRNAQVSAVAEVTTYRVDIAAKQATVYRVVGGTPTQRNVVTIDEPSVSFANSSFTDSSGVTSTSVYFYPKGSASAGSVDVVRAGRSAVYTVSVEGLTARVSYSG